MTDSDESFTEGQLALTQSSIRAGERRVANEAVKFETKYPAIDPDQAWRVIDAFREGLSERDIADIAGLPSKSVVRHWRSISAEFDQACIDAQEDYADSLVGEMMAIADDVDRAPRCRSVSLEHRRWLAACLSRKYRKPGDAGGDSPRAVTVNQQINVNGDAQVGPADAYMRMLRGER